MIYPIVIYGSQTLRNPSENIAPDYPDLAKLVEDMFLTLGEAKDTKSGTQKQTPV